MKQLITILFLIFTQSVLSDEFIERDYRLDFYLGDAYARAVKIDTLRSGGKNEIRLWTEDGESGDTSGYVLTETSKKICKSSLHTKEPNLYVIKSGSCKNSKVSFAKLEFNSVIKSLYELDKAKIECKDIMDGWGGELEGVYEGKRFFISLYNPDSCKEPEAVVITNLLSKIGL